MDIWMRLIHISVCAMSHSVCEIRMTHLTYRMSLILFFFCCHFLFSRYWNETSHIPFFFSFFFSFFLGWRTPNFITGLNGWRTQIFMNKYEWVMSHIWMSHVTHMNESCHTCEWVMSHMKLGGMKVGVRHPRKKERQKKREKRMQKVCVMTYSYEHPTSSLDWMGGAN